MGDAIIPSDWGGEYCLFSVCWPNSPQWLAVLRGVLTIPAEGRFWDESSGTITAAQLIIQNTYDYNLDNREVIMACGDTGLQSVADGLLAIARALGSAQGGNSSCSCLGANIQVQTFIDLSDGSRWPILSSGPLVELPGTGYPDNFDNEEDYLADKCQVATLIVNQLIESLRNMGAVNWATGVIGAAVILACLVGLIVVPEAAIPVLLFALVGNIGITTALLSLADQIETDKEAWICVLYTGDNIETLTGLLADLLDSAIALIAVSGTIGAAIKVIALTLLNGDTLGALFSGAAHQAYPDADCTACEDCSDEIIFESSDGGFVGDIDPISNAGTGSVEWDEDESAWVIELVAIGGIGNATAYHITKTLTPDGFGRKVVVRGTRVSSTNPGQVVGVFLRFRFDEYPDEIYYTGSLDGTVGELNEFVSSYAGVTGYDIILGNGDLGSDVTSVSHILGVTECRVTE